MKLKKNMGAVDRIIRTFLAILFGVLIISGKISGTAGIILGVFAVIFLLTSMISFCPLYILFGIRTTEKNEETDKKD